MSKRKRKRKHKRVPWSQSPEWKPWVPSAEIRALLKAHRRADRLKAVGKVVGVAAGAGLLYKLIKG
jgi:hypothetical protein